MTLKKATKQYAKCHYHLRKLQEALREAIKSGLLVCPDYHQSNPLHSIYEGEKRLAEGCTKAVMAAFGAEIRSDYWKKHP